MSMLVSFDSHSIQYTINGVLHCFHLLTEKELCRVQARKSFNKGRYGNALEWALRSQDNIYVTSIADLFLRVSIQQKHWHYNQTLIEFVFFFFFRFCSTTQKPVKFCAKM